MLQSDRFHALVREVADPYLAKRRNFSVVIGMIWDGKQDIVGYGYGTGEKTPAADLIYEIGSATKVFTTALLADLVREGTVRLTDPIRKFLPPALKVPSYGETEITLEHLATHTSGFPRLPKNLELTWASRGNPYANYTVEQLYAFLSSYRLSRRPPAPFAYSNLGSGLLGHILASVLGVSYEEATRQRICAPLDMGDTLITLDAARHQRLVPGHAPSGKPVPNWDLPTLAGAGALRSTGRDLLRFLSAHLGLLDTPLADSLALCHEPRVTVKKQTQIGLGWLVSEFDGHRVIWHNGATGGYNSYLGFVKEKGVGVCVLTNHTVPLLAAVGLTKPQADHVGQQLLRALLQE